MRSIYSVDALTLPRRPQIILPSVSTTITQTFCCEEYDDGRFLRSDLSLRCNRFGHAQSEDETTSERRRFFVVYAWAMVVIFPIGIPLMTACFLFCFREPIKKLMKSVKEEDERHGMITKVSSIAKSKTRRGSEIVLAQNLKWLEPKFKDFQPNCFWMGPALLAIRLVQTSFMVIFTNATLQAAFASCVALLSMNTQRNFSPFRRASEYVVVFVIRTTNPSFALVGVCNAVVTVYIIFVI